jgi:hypothetical protein
MKVRVVVEEFITLHKLLFCPHIRVTAVVKSATSILYWLVKTPNTLVSGSGDGIPASMDILSSRMPLRSLYVAFHHMMGNWNHRTCSSLFISNYSISISLLKINLQILVPGLPTSRSLACAALAAYL